MNCLQRHWRVTMNSTTHYKKLDKLPENVRATVNLIHDRYEKGEAIRYVDIKKARLEVGMTEGSDATVKKALDAWRDIYAIKLEKFETLEQVDKLVKRTIEIIRDKLKLAYEQESESKIGAANEAKSVIETELAQTRTELDNAKSAVVHEQALVVDLNSRVEELLLEKDTLLEQKRELDKEASNLRVSVGSLEKRLVDKDKQVADVKKNYEALRSDMEAQRQSHIVMIDERKEEAKRANKQMDTLRDKMTRVEQQLVDSKQQLVAEKELVKSLKVEFKSQQQNYQQRITASEKAQAGVAKENTLLAKKISQLETALERERQRHSEQSHGLIEKVEKLIAQSQKKPKSKKAKV